MVYFDTLQNVRIGLFKFVIFCQFSCCFQTIYIFQLLQRKRTCGGCRRSFALYIFVNQYVFLSLSTISIYHIATRHFLVVFKVFSTFLKLFLTQKFSLFVLFFRLDSVQIREAFQCFCVKLQEVIVAVQGTV